MSVNVDNLAPDEAQRTDRIAREQEKWTAYYETLALEPAPEVMQLGEELRAHCDQLLPEGGRILEAGCGAGWQSLALARTGRFQCDLLDFSEAALDAARHVFQTAGVQARFLTGDAFETGEPEYDLVFNAGVIEHYTFEEQRRLIQGMASRSRRYVVVLAPNRNCYWYWVSRVRNSAVGNWPFGKESPAIDFQGIFEAAGLTFAGQTYLARNWTDLFIRNLPGIEEQLREILRLSHASPLISAEQACYIVAGTGTVGGGAVAHLEPARNITLLEQVTGSLSDSLALRINAESALSAERSRRLLTENTAEALRVQLEAQRDRAQRAEGSLVKASAAAETLRRQLEADRERVRDVEARVRAAGERQLQQSRVELADSQAARAAAETSLAEARAHLEKSGNEMEASRVYVQQFCTSAVRFSEAFNQSLAEYRTQRAWKVMLGFRRAYTMLFRQGWKGRLRFLFGPRPPLSAQELIFPLPQNYLPPPPETPEHGEPEGALSTASDAPELPRAKKYDVVVLAIIDFDFRFQRPQQLAAEFARRGHRVFWVTATRVLPEQSAEAYQTTQLRPNVWEVRVRAPQTDLYCGELSDAAASRFHDSLTNFYRDWAIPEAAVVVQLPFWRRLALKLRQPGTILVYDCMDDWDTFENLGNFNRDEEVHLARECDLLVVTAEKLKTKFEGRSLKPLLIRNGADFDFFHTADSLPELKPLRRPIVGYFGAIADWINLDLVREVAAARPQYSFVLAGQVFNRDTSALEALPNVRLLGSRPYDQMPRLLAAFDVCLIPFTLNQVTHATDPVKLYEYLSQGKPVVATAMDELRAWEHLLYLARDTPEFLKKLDSAIAESDPGLREQRIEFARHNNWAARVDLMDSAIRAKFPEVSVLIVTHNTAEFIGPCVESLLANTSYPDWEAIVVDNASTDDTVAIAKKAAGGDPRIRIEALSRNTGFAGGNNAAAALATGDYLIFLNADTMVTPGWMGGLLRHLHTDDSIGLICPVTNFAGNEAKINVDYSVESEMERFALRLAREKRDMRLDVAVAALYCAVMRAGLFRELGGLDEGYVIGMFEDDDLSHAVKARGLRVVVAEDCFIHHFGQGSFAKLPGDEYNRIFSANRQRFETKWKKPWVPHQTRLNVRPAFEEQRFKPDTFCQRRSDDDAPERSNASRSSG